jgi:hypothetical protein
MAHYAGWDGETPERFIPLIGGGRGSADNIPLGRIAREWRKWSYNTSSIRIELPCLFALNP